MPILNTGGNAIIRGLIDPRDDGDATSKLYVDTADGVLNTRITNEVMTLNTAITNAELTDSETYLFLTHTTTSLYTDTTSGSFLQFVSNGTNVTISGFFNSQFDLVEDELTDDGGLVVIGQYFDGSAFSTRVMLLSDFSGTGTIIVGSAIDVNTGEDLDFSDISSLIRISGEDGDKINHLSRGSGAGIQVVDTDPTGTLLVEGVVWYNTTDDVIRYYDGAATQTVQTVIDFDQEFFDKFSDNGTHVDILEYNNTVAYTEGDIVRVQTSTAAGTTYQEVWVRSGIQPGTSGNAPGTTFTTVGHMHHTFQYWHRVVNQVDAVTALEVVEGRRDVTAFDINGNLRNNDLYGYLDKHYVYLGPDYLAWTTNAVDDETEVNFEGSIYERTDTTPAPADTMFPDDLTGAYPNTGGIALEGFTEFTQPAAGNARGFPPDTPEEYGELAVAVDPLWTYSVPSDINGGNVEMRSGIFTYTGTVNKVLAEGSGNLSARLTIHTLPPTLNTASIFLRLEHRPDATGVPPAFIYSEFITVSEDDNLGATIEFNIQGTDEAITIQPNDELRVNISTAADEGPGFSYTLHDLRWNIDSSEQFDRTGQHWTFVKSLEVPNATSTAWDLLSTEGVNEFAVSIDDVVSFTAYITNSGANADPTDITNAVAWSDVELGTGATEQRTSRFRGTLASIPASDTTIGFTDTQTVGVGTDSHIQYNNVNVTAGDISIVDNVELIKLVPDATAMDPDAAPYLVESFVPKEFGRVVFINNSDSGSDDDPNTTDFGTSRLIAISPYTSTFDVTTAAGIQMVAGADIDSGSRFFGAVNVESEIIILERGFQSVAAQVNNTGQLVLVGVDGEVIQFSGSDDPSTLSFTHSTVDAAAFDNPDINENGIFTGAAYLLQGNLFEFRAPTTALRDAQWAVGDLGYIMINNFNNPTRDPALLSPQFGDGTGDGTLSGGDPASDFDTDIQAFLRFRVDDLSSVDDDATETRVVAFIIGDQTHRQLFIDEADGTIPNSFNNQYVWSEDRFQFWDVVAEPEAIASEHIAGPNLDLDADAYNANPNLYVTQGHLARILTGDETLAITANTGDLNLRTDPAMAIGTADTTNADTWETWINTLDINGAISQFSAANRNYSVGDLVYINNVATLQFNADIDNRIYRCITAHTTAIAIGFIPANWQELSASTGGEGGGLDEYNETTTEEYELDDVVWRRVDNRIYRCSIAHTTATGAFVPANWTELSPEATPVIPTFATTTGNLPLDKFPLGGVEGQGLVRTGTSGTFEFAPFPEDTVVTLIQGNVEQFTQVILNTTQADLDINERLAFGPLNTTSTEMRAGTGPTFRGTISFENGVDEAEYSIVNADIPAGTNITTNQLGYLKAQTADGTKYVFNIRDVGVTTTRLHLGQVQPADASTFTLVLEDLVDVSIASMFDPVNASAATIAENEITGGVWTVDSATSAVSYDGTFLFTAGTITGGTFNNFFLSGASWATDDFTYTRASDNISYSYRGQTRQADNGSGTAVWQARARRFNNETFESIFSDWANAGTNSQAVATSDAEDLVDTQAAAEAAFLGR